MRKCLADPSLNISQQPFKRPANMSIKVDCGPEPSRAVTDSTATDSLAVPTDAQPDTESIDGL